MGKKLIFLASLVVLLSCFSAANAGLEVKVDLAKPDIDVTAKPGWNIWAAVAWDNEDRHDPVTIENIGGTDIGAVIRCPGENGALLKSIVEGGQDVDPICNTFHRHYDGDALDVELLLFGLAPGVYTLKSYHRDPAGYPNMPQIEALVNDIGDSRYSSWAPVGEGTITQIPTGEGNDVNVPIAGDPISDDELTPSIVKFETDGTPALIRYHAGSGPAVLNAFIIVAGEPNTSWAPVPGHQTTEQCPDTILEWNPGKYADTHDVYFGTNWDDVNDATTDVDPNNVYMDNFDVNEYDPTTSGVLELGTTYYWRVDEVNDACEPYLWKGNVWSFTTEDGKARNPSPEDNAGSRPLDGVTLSWTPSCLATSGDYLYFSTNFEDVNSSSVSVRHGPIYDASFDTGSLELGERYYWKVNGIGSEPLPEGDIWKFQAIGYPVMYYKFDGVEDACLPDPITDSTGNVTFEYGPGYGSGGYIKYGQSNPIYNPSGASALFLETTIGGETKHGYLYREATGDDTLDLASDAYTIEAWFKLNSYGNLIDDEEYASTIIRKYEGSYILAIGEDGAIRFAHSGDDADDNLAESDTGLVNLDTWYHVAAVYDSQASDANQIEKLYFNGIVVADNNLAETNPGGYENDLPVTIGAMSTPFYTGGQYTKNIFDGSIDELRVVDVALEPEDFLLRGDPNLAWLPIPFDYEDEAPVDCNLIWHPGDLASSHDVYFGTSWNDVNTADTTSAVFQDNVGPNTFDPVLLDFDTTYYWRIDEVNETTSDLWTGMIWRFTTANYRNLEDFEAYATDNELTSSWSNGGYSPDNGSCATIHVGKTFYEEPAYGGEQSLDFSYANGDQGYPYGVYYSETEHVFDPNWDFTAIGVQLLTFYFHGDSGSEYWEDPISQMYVGLKDTEDTYEEVRYGDASGEDINDIKTAQWQEWNVPLNEFTTVELEHIASIVIGFGDRTNTTTPEGRGKVYIDEIRLYPSKCIPSMGPQADFSGDCLVGYADIALMLEHWLDSDVDLPVSAPSPGPVARWELDGDATDSAGSYDGTAQGDYSWVTGQVGQAIGFSGDGGKVLVDDAEALRPENEVSVCAWMRAFESPDSSRVVVKGADNKEAYDLEVDGDDLTFCVRDGQYPTADDFPRYAAATEDEPLAFGQWNHIAGTYDGNSVKCYVNAQLAGKDNDLPEGMDPCDIVILSQDVNGLAIGNRSDANDKEFIGDVDDVYLYNYALTAEQIAYVATAPDNDGYFPLFSDFNLYNGEPEGSKAVNLRDLAALLDDWMDEVLWP